MTRPAQWWAVIVVGFNQPDLLATHLVPLSTPGGPTIVVVDNSTESGALLRTKLLCEKYGWDHVDPGGNLGFGAAMNLGVRIAEDKGAQVFLLLNPDASLSAADAESLARQCLAEPNVAVSPRVLRPDGGPWFTGGGVDWNTGRLQTKLDSSSQQVTWLSGACLAISRLLWQQVGGFDPDYFLYWEDVDLSCRITEAGGKLSVRDDMVCVHEVGATQSSMEHKSPVFIYFNARNRLRFASRHARRSQAWGWMAASPRIAWELYTMGGRTREAGVAAIKGTSRGLSDLIRRPRRASRPPSLSRRSS